MKANAKLINLQI